MIDGNPFAGLTCEYGATKSCMTLGSDSKHSFCTNGGECDDIVGDNEVHKDCICTGEFEGPHCEYKTGTTPTFIANAQSAALGSPQPLMSDTALYSAMAAVCVLIGVVMISFFVRARGRRTEAMKKERELHRATEELAMVNMDDDSTKGFSNRPAFV